MVLLGVSFLTLTARAQYANWGSGAYSAMPKCNLELRAGRDVVNVQNQIADRRNELSRKRAEQSRVRSQIDSLRSRERAARDAFREISRLDGGDFNLVESHINSGAACSQYQGFCSFGGYSIKNPPPSSVYFAGVVWNFMPPPDENEDPAEKGTSNRLPAADLGGAPPPNSYGCREGRTPVAASFQPVFFAACGDGGRIDPSICRNGVSIRNAARCDDYLNRWLDAIDQRRRLAEQEADLRFQIQDLEAAARLDQADYEEARRRYEEDLRRVQTEGGCVECYVQQHSQPRNPWWLDIAGIGVHALLGYQSMKAQQAVQQYAIDANAAIGFRTNGAMPINASGYGYALLANGLLGYLAGGLGQGGFGCSGGAFGAGFPMGAMGLAGANGVLNLHGPFGFGNPAQNALFGYPQGLYGVPPGAGAFLPGVGANVQIGLGSQAYCPRWPCPVGAGGFGGGGVIGGFPGIGGGFGGGINLGLPGFGGGGYVGAYPGSYAPPVPMGAVGFGGYAPGAFPAGFGPGSVGFNAGIGLGGGAYGGMGGAHGFGGMPGVYGYGGLPMGGGLGGYGGFGGGVNFQAQAQAAQAAAQAAAQQAAWLNQYQNQQAQMAALAAQMATLQGQMTATASQMGGMPGGVGGGGYLGINYNLFGGAGLGGGYGGYPGYGYGGLGGGVGGGFYGGFGAYPGYGGYQQQVPGFVPGAPPPPPPPGVGGPAGNPYR